MDNGERGVPRPTREGYIFEVILSTTVPVGGTSEWRHQGVDRRKKIVVEFTKDSG